MSNRPDYQRIRWFLTNGGVLQREIIPPTNMIVWCAAQRDGRFFDANTCEWFRMRKAFVLHGHTCWLTEVRPGIYQLAYPKEYLTDTEE